MFIAVLWFSYVLAIYCIVYVAFKGLPKKSTDTGPGLEFAPAWDLRVQFYPLCILIALPTSPFIYLFTKIFKSDILVRSFHPLSKVLRCANTMNDFRVDWQPSPSWFSFTLSASLLQSSWISWRKIRFENSCIGSLTCLDQISMLKWSSLIFLSEKVNFVNLSREHSVRSSLQIYSRQLMKKMQSSGIGLFSSYIFWSISLYWLLWTVACWHAPVLVFIDRFSTRIHSTMTCSPNANEFFNWILHLRSTATLRLRPTTMRKKTIIW